MFFAVAGHSGAGPASVAQTKQRGDVLTFTSDPMIIIYMRSKPGSSLQSGAGGVEMILIAIRSNDNGMRTLCKLSVRAPVPEVAGMEGGRGIVCGGNHDLVPYTIEE